MAELTQTGALLLRKRFTTEDQVLDQLAISTHIPGVLCVIRDGMEVISVHVDPRPEDNRPVRGVHRVKVWFDALALQSIDPSE